MRSQTTALSSSTRLLGAAGLAAALVLAPLPASAHDQLISSDPADGAVLDAAPDTLTLSYSAEILAQGSAVVVQDADGLQYVIGTPEVSGTDLVADLDEAAMTGGSYQVTWRVVSSDGHPIDGTFAFSVGEQSDLSGGVAAPDGSGDEKDEPADASEGTSTADATAEASQEAEGDQAESTELSTPAQTPDEQVVSDTSQTTQNEERGSSVPLVVGAVVLAAGLVGGLMIWKRRNAPNSEA